MLAGCAQLDACSFREGFHAEVAEQAVRDTQLLAGVDVATNAAQPSPQTYASQLPPCQPVCKAAAPPAHARTTATIASTTSPGMGCVGMSQVAARISPPPSTSPPRYRTTD